MANKTLDQLGVSIDRFATKAVSYLTNPFSEDAAIFGAFCARVTLENACAALVGRLDTFRMLYLAEFQTQGGFDYGKPSRSGFKWTGDVLTEDKPVRDLWSGEHEISKISRALFSPHVEHVYWRPAIEAALDYLSNDTGDDLDDLRGFNPESFISVTKGKCSGLYSKLSKGVHWDFFVPTVMMDEPTLKDAIRDCFLQVSAMGFVSHFVPTAFRSLERSVALNTYRTFRQVVQ